jgi:hypothetical protein
MRLLVIIPTTGGPLIVKSLKPRQGLPASTAFAEGDFRPLPWSADYARLCTSALAPVIGGLVPHELRLSGSFDAGRSWEAPVALAHLLLARGHSLVASPDEAEAILWTTGAVDLDLAPIPGHYALIDKLALSADLLARSDRDLIAILPPGAEQGAATRQLRDSRPGRLVLLDPAPLPVQTSALEARFAGGTPSGKTALPAITPTRPAKANWGAVALALLVLSGGAAAALFVLQKPPVPTVPLEPIKVDPGKEKIANPGPDKQALPKPPDPKPVEPKPIEPKPVEPKPVDPKPVDPKPVEPKPVDPKPVEPKPIEPKPVDPKPVEPKPVDPKPVEPKQPIAIPEKPPVILSEILARSAQECRKLVFGAAQVTNRPVPLAGDHFADSTFGPTLCGLAIAPADKSVQFTITGDLSGAALPVTVQADGTEIFVLKTKISQNLVYQIQVTGKDGEKPRSYAHRLIVSKESP